MWNVTSAMRGAGSTKPRGGLPRVALASLVSGLLVAGCSGGDSGPTRAEPTGTAEIDQVVREIDDYVAAYVGGGTGQAPGLLALVRIGDESRTLALGLANTSTSTPMRADQRFPVASLTKMFVATTVLQLVDEGRLRLDDTAERWLPGVVPRGRTITVEDLLSMRTGIPDRTQLPSYSFDLDLTPQRRHFLVSGRPTAAPGTVSDYSNVNFDVLGWIVEAVTGQPLGDVLHDRVFVPAGMASTSFEPDVMAHPPDVHGYDVDGSLRRVEVTPTDLSGVWAAGAAVSTLGDVDRFLSALSGGILLRGRSAADMATPRGELVPVGTRVGYGLGEMVIQIPCGEAIGHHGELNGYRIAAFRLSGSHRQVVVMVSTSAHAVPVERLVGASLTSGLC